MLLVDLSVPLRLSQSLTIPPPIFLSHFSYLLFKKQDIHSVGFPISWAWWLHSYIPCVFNLLFMVPLCVPYSQGFILGFYYPPNERIGDQRGKDTNIWLPCMCPMCASFFPLSDLLSLLAPFYRWGLERLISPSGHVTIA